MPAMAKGKIFNADSVHLSNVDVRVYVSKGSPENHKQVS